MAVQHSLPSARLPAPLLKAWRQWRQQLAPSAAKAKIEPLAFDASVRRYFRVKGQGLILTWDPLLKKSDRQLVIYKILAQHKIPVPTIYFAHPEQGVLLQADGGISTLLPVVAAAKNQWPWLKKALTILSRCHQIDLASYNHSPFRKECFDEAKLMMEVDFTLTYFARQLLQATSAECHALRRSWQKLCRTLAEGPWVLVHRDFHTRNLVVQGRKLAVVDYQDARLGLPQYDLASLFYDAYFAWDARNLARGLAYYWKISPKVRALFKNKKKVFQQKLQMMAAQRLFKALGTFAYQMVQRKNPRYLKYIGHTMANLRQVLAGQKKWQKLYQQICQLYYPRS